jgi:hypothetical protein
MHRTVCERGTGALLEWRIFVSRRSSPEDQIVEGLKRGLLIVHEGCVRRIWVLSIDSP